MKKLIVLGIVLGLAGCNQTGVPAETSVEDARVGTSSLSGKVTVSNGIVILNGSEGSTTLESYSVDLNEYDGQQVMVEGQYSGDTLFVDKVDVVTVPLN